MKSLVRFAIFVAVVAVVLGTASAAVAAPVLKPGLGYTDAPHGNAYASGCTDCHKFQIWPAPSIMQGAAPAHGPRGTDCAQCHTVTAPQPVDLSAPAVSAGTVSNAEITLGWTAVPGASGYRVYRAAASKGPFTQCASTTAQSFRDTRRAAKTVYYYRVRAVDPLGTLGPVSATRSARSFAGSTTVRVDSSLSQLTLSGSGWTTLKAKAYYGGSTRSTSLASRKLTAPFRGTAVTWYGTRGPGFGKASVYVDGKFAKTVDLYSASTLYNRPLFSRKGLSNTSHTISITVISARNAKSAGRRVDVDSFGVTGVVPGLIQEDHRATYGGKWSAVSAASYSGMQVHTAARTSTVASYKFVGTGVTWLGTKGMGFGKAKVYVDGVLKGTVDSWAARTVYRCQIFSMSGLRKAAHTVRIVPTGAHNVCGTASEINVDAFVTR